MARITVEEISRKEFSFANKGYNQKEVDDFLDDICDEGRAVPCPPHRKDVAGWHFCCVF